MKEEEKTQFPGVTHYTKVDVQPGGINIQHVEHLHQADVLKALGIELEIKRDAGPLGAAESAEPLSDFVLKLMPIFFDNEEWATQFVKEIEGKNGLEITEAVKRFREKKMLSAQLCHHALWAVLNEYKRYTLTERNWNARIGY